MSVEGREGPELLTSIVDDYKQFTVTVSGEPGPPVTPVADLLNPICPKKAAYEQSVTLGINVKNTSTVAGHIWTQIYETDTDTLVKNLNKYMEPGESWEWTDSFPMPDNDWKLTFRVGHFMDGSIEDETIDKTITLTTEGLTLWEQLLAWWSLRSNPEKALILGVPTLGVILLLPRRPPAYYPPPPYYPPPTPPRQETK